MQTYKINFENIAGLKGRLFPESDPKLLGLTQVFVVNGCVFARVQNLPLLWTLFFVQKVFLALLV